MALGGGHVVTKHGSPKGSLIYTVFTKKVSKTVKGGIPPVFGLQKTCVTLLGAPRARGLLAVEFAAPFQRSRGQQKPFRGVCSSIHPPGGGDALKKSQI